MNACHADIVERFDGISEHPGGHERFLGDRDIARPGRHDEDRSTAAGRLGRLIRSYDAGGFMKTCLLNPFFDAVEVFPGSSRCEQRLSAPGEAERDFGDLKGGFSLAKNHFRKPLPELPVVVDCCKAEGFRAQCVDRVHHLPAGEFPAFKLLEEVFEFFFCHARCCRWSAAVRI